MSTPIFTNSAQAGKPFCFSWPIQILLILEASFCSPSTRTPSLIVPVLKCLSAYPMPKMLSFYLLP